MPDSKPPYGNAAAYSPPWVARGAGDLGFFDGVPAGWLNGSSTYTGPVDEYTGGVTFGVVSGFTQFGPSIGQPSQLAQIGGNGLFSINGPGIISNFGPFGLNVGGAKQTKPDKPDTSRGGGYFVPYAAAWPARQGVAVQFRHSLYPVGGNGGPDTRFEPRPAVPPPDHPSYPGGTRVVMLETTEEGKQVTVPFHADARLIAANKGPSASYGTPVCEVTQRGDIATNRQAPLQTFLRVIHKPSRAGTECANSIAWQIGFAGRKDALAGLVAENGFANEDVPRLGRVSRTDGGPFALMGPRCKHRLGVDADGSAIAPVHLAAESLFSWADGDPLHDGPLAMTTQPVPEAPFQGYEQQVRCGWDRAWLHTSGGRPFRGGWNWWTRVIVGTTEPSEPEPPPYETKDPPPVPPAPPPPTTGGPPVPSPGSGGGPTTGGGDGGGPTFGGGPGGDPPTTGGGGGTYEYVPLPPPQEETDEELRQRHERERELFRENGGPQKTITNEGTRSGVPRDHASTFAALGVPAMVYRARRVVTGAPDTAYNPSASPAEIAAYERTAPAVLRVEAYGEQAGTDFIHTQEPGKSTHRAGTADGGIWHFVPEIGLEDSGAGFTSDTNRSVSSATVGYGPGVAVAFGTPSTDTGGMADGVRTMRTASGTATISASTDGASWTDLVRYTVDGTNFRQDVSIEDGKNVAVSTTSGTKIGTGTTQKLGFWNAAPVPQYATTGTLTGFVAGAGTTMTHESTVTGDNGTKAYTLGDVVRALKAAGIMAAS